MYYFSVYTLEYHLVNSPAAIMCTLVSCRGKDISLYPFNNNVNPNGYGENKFYPGYSWSYLQCVPGPDF